MLQKYYQYYKPVLLIVLLIVVLLIILFVVDVLTLTHGYNAVASNNSALLRVPMLLVAVYTACGTCYSVF